MNKFLGILTLLTAGAFLFSGCEETRNDIRPEYPGEIILRNDYYTTTLHTPILLNILANDSITTDAELTIQQPVNGVLVPDLKTGTYLFKPTGNQKSEEVISYTVCHGANCKTAFVKLRVVDMAACFVTALHDYAETNFPAPVRIPHDSLMANDMICGRVALSVDAAQTVPGGMVAPHPDGKSVVFTPTNPNIGNTRFYYLLSGSVGSDTAWVHVKVEPPVTQVCNISTTPDIVFAGNLPVGGYISHNVTENDDLDDCGSNLTCEIVTNPVNGRLVGYPFNGEDYLVNYVRDSANATSDYIEYRACKIIDGQQVCKIGKVYIYFDIQTAETNYE